jgi:hypothetical protein
MDSSILGLVELLLVFLVVMGFGLRELASLRSQKPPPSSPPGGSETAASGDETKERGAQDKGRDGEGDTP